MQKKNDSKVFHKNAHFYIALAFAFVGICYVLWGGA